MKETQDLTKMEFVIKLNDNIVVQRFFNVKGYNETAKYSLELHDYMKDIADYMERYLKDKRQFVIGVLMPKCTHRRLDIP